MNDWTKDREIKRYNFYPGGFGQCDSGCAAAMMPEPDGEYVSAAARAEVERLMGMLAKVAASGVLCDPGCCGDDCACDDIRALLKIDDGGK